MQYSMLDYELNLLRHLIHVIDQHLDHIYKESLKVDNPDSLGYFDNAEHVVGLGFVACQTYLSSVCGYLKVEKRKALSVGPLHPSGQTKVEIINHAANFWKHNSEWSLNKDSRQKKFDEDALESLGFPVGIDYPLSGVLNELTIPDVVKFESIVKVLEAWKDELHKTAV